MIRASAGTWANYATTVVFQILFAAAFGTSADASAFVIAFAIAISASGLFVTTSLTVILPRIVTDDGALARRAVAALAVLAVAAAGVGLLLLAVAVVAPDRAATVIGAAPADAQALLVLAAVLVVLLALAGMLGSVALARGHRFLPALAPALPSTLGAAYLATDGAPSVVGAFAAMTFGAVLQLSLCAYLAVAPRPRIVDTAPLRTRNFAAWTILMLAALNLIPPVQRVLATSLESGGAAQFDYAARGVHLVLQLTVGGLVIASLPDWSVLRRRASHLRADVTRAAALVIVLLTVTASVMGVAVVPAIRLVLERGAFTAADSEAVALLVRILLPGFVAEGLTLVLTQSLLAVKFTRAFLRIGFARFVVQGATTVILGMTLGAVGVAVAYSITLVFTAALTTAAVWRAGILRHGGSLLPRAVVAAVIPASAGVLALFVLGDEGGVVAAAIVLLVGAVMFFWLRLAEVLPAAMSSRLGAMRGRIV